MNSVFARFAVASFAALLAAPALAAQKPVHVVQPVRAVSVAKSVSGREIVKADGIYYIELQSSDLSQVTAQEMYEKYRAKFKALMNEDLNKDKEYRFPGDGNFAYSPATLGFSLIDGHKTNGITITPTREYRMNSNPGAQPYLIIDGSEEQGAVLTAGCRNAQGTPDVVGLNYGRNGCYGMVKLFRRINLK